MCVCSTLCHVPFATLPFVHSIFFFYSSGDHRALHSFPTRRSSDLMNAYRAVQSGEQPRTPKNWLIAIAHNVCRKRCRQDRKSTRLNSSHEWISYAVFCLKKKKEKNIVEQL